MSNQQHGNEQGEPEQINHPFNPAEHLIQIKGRNGIADYLPVQWRLVWFRSVYPNGSIETEMLHFDPERECEEISDAWNDEQQQPEKIVKRGKGLAIFKAIARDGLGGVGTGTKSETAANFKDFIESAETGAIGRALASLGFGTQFAPEFQEEHRIVDSPVTRSSKPSANGHSPAPTAIARVAEKRSNYKASSENQDSPDQLITETQLASIRKLFERVGKSEPENVGTITRQEAKELIAQLSQEYRQSRSRAS